MASALRFFVGDTAPYFAVQILRKSDNTAVDLTGYTVDFSMRNTRSPRARVVRGPAVITDAVTGKVEYRWTDGDLAVPGVYLAEFRGVSAGGRVQSVLIEDVEVAEVAR